MEIEEDVYIGMHALCLGHGEMGHKGFLVAKAIVTCLPGHKVPVNILSPTAESVRIHKGAYLATFKLCDNYTDILSVRSAIKQCMHAKLHSTSQSDAQSNLYFASKDRDSISFNDGAQPDISKEKIYTHFADNISKDLLEEQREQLFECLCDHQNVFVTLENPNLGLTHEVEHFIQLKPDAKSKHQRPYRLSPGKKQVLRHHLDELLRQ